VRVPLPVLVTRPAIVLLCARFGLLHLLASSGTCPFRPEVALPAPLRRRRCGSTGADPSSAAWLRSRDPQTGLWLHVARRDCRAAPGDPRHSRLGTCGDLPASPSSPHLRCPGAVTPRAAPLAAGFQPRPAPSPVAADHSPAIDSLAMPRSEDQLAARRPLARDGAVSAGHLPPVQRRCRRPNRVGPREGETGEFWRRRRYRLQASVTIADAEPR
jgi:hypothetical protein